MNAWALLSFPAWLILAITAAARLHDMAPEDWAPRDHVRRAGMIGAGFLSALMAFAPFTLGWWKVPAADWLTTSLAWSWAFIWLTTKGTPPWWDFILGVHRKTEEWARLGWRARVRGEWRALRDSFKPTRKRPPMVGPQGTLP